MAEALLQICDCGPTFSFASPKENADKRKRARRDFDFPPDLLEPTKKTAPGFLDLSRADLKVMRSQEALLKPMQIRTPLQVSKAPSIDRNNSKALANKFDTILTCGAYHSARIVAKCECRSYQISFLLELHRGTSPVPPALFSPLSFLLREKRQGRRRHDKPKKSIKPP